MKVPIFYDPRQSVAELESYSPSAGKPARFVQAAIDNFEAINLQPVTPITRDDLLIAHAKNYVDGVFDGTTLNGFENRDPRVPESCRWTIGSLTTAALNAHRFNTPVCSPTSGFHHAGYSWGGGYCTFNGLTIAAAKFIEANPGARVAILDLDWHYGDGVVSVLKHKPELAANVFYATSGKHFHGGEPTHEFFSWLQQTTAEINAFKPDLLIYQAGADMSLHDPLGGLLSDYELTQRDRLVFSKIQVPTVFNLAGGYQTPTRGRDPVINIHLRTLAIASATHRP